MTDVPLQAWFWLSLSRIGESEILLPAFLAGALWLAFARPAWARGRLAATVHGHAHPARDVALRWFAGLAATTAAVVVSKVAFFGFGIGSATLDFTGFSGHSMYSMAILPVLVAILFGRTGAVLGVLLAAAIMVSRVEVQAHSWSEAISGMVLGATVAWWTLSCWMTHPGAVRAPWWLPLLVVVWLGALPRVAPRSHTHDMVVALSLKLSGRVHPYTRYDLRSGAIHRVVAVD